MQKRIREGVVVRLTQVGIVLLVGSLAACGSSGAGGGSASGSGIGPGITEAKPLPPFVPSAEAGEKPDLPKTLAFVIDSPGQAFEQNMASGFKAGTHDAGLQYSEAVSDGDPQKHVQALNQFLVQGVGALVTNQVNPAAQKPVMLDAIQRGVMMNSIIFGPAVSQLNAPLYGGGKALATAAADYVKASLGGKANVVLLTQDSVEPLRPRAQAMRDVLGTLPGVKIVADIEPETIDPQGGFEAMTTILQANPDIDVVIGSDEVVIGAQAALQASGRGRANQFLGGIDCDSAALAEIKKGGVYRACVGTEPAIFAYAWARFAGDWLEGKSVPQAISANAKTVTTPQQAQEYDGDQADPARVWADPTKLSEYLSFFGKISYGTRNQYLAYTWNPEAK